MGRLRERSAPLPLPPAPLPPSPTRPLWPAPRPDCGALSAGPGVYQGCNKTNLVIDHAVQLVGYGAQPGGRHNVRGGWARGGGGQLAG